MISFEHLTFFDWCIILVQIGFIAWGGRRGMIGSIVGVIGIILAIYLAIAYHTSLSLTILPDTNPLIAKVVSSIIILFSVLLLEKILAQILQQLLNSGTLKHFKVINRIGGLLIGVYLGWSLISLAIFHLKEIPVVQKAILVQYYQSKQNIFNIAIDNEKIDLPLNSKNIPSEQSIPSDSNITTP